MSEVDFEKISRHKKPEVSPGYLLWQVSTLWRRAIEARLKPLGLTHPQFVVLASLAWLSKQGDEVSQIQIARQSALDPNTISQILKGLETKKLIKRIRSSDERRKFTALTVKGASVLTKAMAVVEDQDDHFFSPLAVQETNFLHNLQILLNGMY